MPRSGEEEVPLAQVCSRPTARAAYPMPNPLPNPMSLAQVCRPSPYPLS